ncbi:MAG: hypothetical protein ABI947_22265 [Chloroflexota bacterium]
MRDVSHVEGPGWSPSGKWFAWTAQELAKTEAQSVLWERSFLIRSDGAYRSAQIDNITSPKMQWSPHDDVLLVTSQLPNYDTKNQYFGIRTFVALVDPNRNVTLTLKNSSEEGEFGGEGLNSMWLDDQFIVENSNHLSGDLFIIGDKAGHLVEKTVTGVISQLADIDDVHPTDNAYRISVSSIGNVAYRTDSALVVENLLTGKRLTFPPLSDKDMNIQWSPDGRYGLLFGSHVSLLSLENGQLKQFETGVLPSPTCGLPQPLWSPNSQHALFVIQDVLYHLSSDTAKLELLSTSNPCTSWSWQENAQALLYDHNGTKAFVEDFATGSQSTVFSGQAETAIWEPEISPDKHYLMYMAGGTAIYDLQTRQTRLLSPASASWMAGGNGEVIWNKDSKWALTFLSGLVAGGGYCCRHLGVARADGSLQRDLSFIEEYVSPIALNWLPDQVNPSMLPTPQKQALFPKPNQSLYGTDWSFQLVWSPDSKNLLSSGGGETNSNTSILMWNIATGKSTVAFPQSADNSIPIWGKNEAGNYLPKVVTNKISPWDSRRILATSPNGRQIVVDNTLADPYSSVYDAVSYKLIYRLEPKFQDIYSASYSPDGQYLAIGSPFYPAQIWDTTTWQIVATLRDPAPAVAFSPDGHYLAASNSWNIDIWNLKDVLRK